VRVDWSRSAVGDLKAIAEWIEQDRDLETANRIARAIYDAVQSLRTMPYRAATAGWRTRANSLLHAFRTSSFIRFFRNAWLS
jgi:plasmid stabilization system protein ParE